jgi:hypothetical protein
MPQEFDDCVSALKNSGKSNDSAYAICTAKYIKSHGKSPFKDESDITALDIKSDTKTSIKMMHESIGKQSLKVTQECTGRAL